MPKEDTQFKKGKSGNPNGRPPGTFSLKSILQQEIQRQPKGKKLSYAMALIKKQLHQAIIDGDAQTQKLIWNYIEGMPIQDITSGGEKLPIPILNVLHNDIDKKDSAAEEEN